MSTPLTIMGAACVQWVAADLALTLGGTPLARGTTPPVVTWGTNLALRTDVPYIACDGAGTVVTATFRWSLDGGATWQGTGLSATATIAAMTTASAPIPSFPVGNYAANNTYSPRVATWIDQVAVPRNFANATISEQPELIYNAINGVRGVKANGTSRLPTTWGLPAPGTTPSYILMIARLDSWTTNRNLFGSDISEAVPGVLCQSNVYGSSPWLVCAPGQYPVIAPLGLFLLFQFYFSGSTATDSAQAGASSGVLQPGGVNTAAYTGNLQLFSRTGIAAPIDATACEFVVLNRKPTSTELTNLLAYFSGKYGSQVVNAINVAIAPANAGNAQKPALGRSRPTLSVVQTQLASILRPTSKPFTATQIQAALLANRALVKALSKTNVQIPVANKTRSVARSVTQSQLASMLRNIGFMRATAQTQAPDITKDLGKRFSATQTQTPSEEAEHNVPLSFSTVQAQVASIVEELFLYFDALQTQAASLGGSNYARLIEVLQVQFPHVMRAAPMRFDAQNFQDVVVNIFKSRIFSASNFQTPSMRRASHTLGAIYADLLALVRPRIAATLEAQTRGITATIAAKTRPVTTVIAAALLQFSKRHK